MYDMHEWARTLLLWPSITKHLQLFLHEIASRSWNTARPRSCAHAVACTDPNIYDFDATHRFKAMVVLLCLRNGNVDAQVTNRHGRVELQRTVVAHNTHLQQCLADFCSLELVHGVHCPRWASCIVYLDGCCMCLLTG